MSGYPHTLTTELKNCSNMEALAFFYQHSMDMIGWFKQNKGKIESSNPDLDKWTALETISHVLYWDHLFMEHRFMPTANGERKLISLDDPRTNTKSITIAAKGFSYLIQDLERSRKQMTNILGELEDKQWENYSFHPEWKRVDLFRLIEELVKHDCHHGKAIEAMIS